MGEQLSKLLVGIPLYHWTPATFFMNWLAMDKTNVMATVSVNGAYITTSCAMMVESALQLEDWDRFVILEHDMIPPRDAFVRMAHYTSEHDIVSALYFGHAEPFTPMAYIDYPDNHLDPITPGTVKRWTEEPALYRVDGTGFGMISIARHVIEKWDPKIPMFWMDKNVGSHDLWFSRKARAQGFSIYLDTGIICEHLSQIKVGLSHNQSATLPEGTVIKSFDYRKLDEKECR